MGPKTITTDNPVVVRQRIDGFFEIEPGGAVITQDVCGEEREAEQKRVEDLLQLRV